MIMAENKNINVDEKKLRQTADKISSSSESYNANLNRLEKCLAQLPSFWSGPAEQAYTQTLMYDLEDLRELGEIFSNLAANYRFACNEYEKIAHKTLDIVSALKIQGE